MASNISISDVIVDELAGFAAFVIRLDVASTQTVSVNYATANGTASGGGSSGYDYIATSGTIQFAPGELTKTVQVQINEDSYWEEPFHQFTMNLSGAVNATIYDGVATGTIYDNDAPVGTPNAKVSDIVVDETTGTATFVITLDRPSDSTVSIDFATQDGSAKAGSDYVAKSGTLSFAAGEAVKTVSVALTNDTVAEGDETFGLALSGFVNAATLTPRATATIAANDATAVTSPQISIADVIVDEASGYANFVVRLSAPGTQTVSFNYATANGTASGGGSSGYDYIATSGVLKFAPGQTVQTIQVPINEDSYWEEPFHQFTMNLSGAVNATIYDGVATGTIYDNDAPVGTPNAKVSDIVVDETTGTATFVITLDRPSDSTVSIDFATQDGSAKAGSDYVAQSGTLDFAAGESVKTVTVALTNDAVAEGDETFGLVLSGFVNAATLTPRATATIAANDATAVTSPQISIADVIVDEASGYANFVVRLSAPGTQTVSVNYATANGTASGGGSSGYDYIATSGVLKFAPGQTVQTIQVPINEDSYWEEPFHQFTMNLSGAVNATIYDGVATGTIYDNDAPVGTPNAKVSDIVVDETTGTATFVITLDRPSDSTVSIDFATQDGSAKAGSDYVAQSGTLDFAAGESVKTVTVALTNDTVAEGDETFGLVLSNFVNAATLTPRATATIAANDATAVTSPQITIADVIVDEVSGFANFVVRLSAPGTQTVSVNYATANGTASGGSSSNYDYIGTSGVLKFAPGQTVQTIQVPINDDGNVRGTIDFKLNLSGAVNATIADSQAIGTIFDDEGPLITSNEGKGFATATVAENSTAVTTVTATNPAGGALAYSIVGGDDLGLFNIDVATGVLTFKTAPDFEAPGDVGSNNVYNLTVRVSDGTLSSYQLLAVSVTNVNESPRFTTGASLSAPENGTTIATIAATDPDADANLTFSITGGADAALLQINASTGALSFKTAPNFEAPGDAGANRVYDVTIKVSDGALTASKAFAITLTNVNETPTITSNGGGVNAAVSIVENTRAVTTVTATDPDAGATRTFSITGGADAALFQIDSATGALSFKTAPNFEVRGDAGANNVYDVIVQVSDGVLTDSQAIAVTVTNANDAPRITSNGGGASAAVSVAENGSAVTKVVAVDDDAGAAVTYSITGGADAALFRISSTGALAFISRPNFERPLDAGGNNVYDVVVTASDGVLTDSQALAVTVTNVNEAPVIRSNGAGATASIALAENTLAVTRVIGRDPDAGATLTYSIVGGADAAAFSINATRGTLTLLKAANFEAPADVGNDNTYDVIVQVSDGTLVDQQTLHITVQDVLNEVITGTRQADTLSGAGGDDTIFGLAGGDILNGSTGDDILYGGTGRDSLTGGLGADTFVFDSALNATSNRDTIVDFVASEGDTIQLSRSIFQAFTANGALSASQFVAGAGITEGTDANDFIIYNTTSGVLSYDADGVGGNAAIAFALLGTGSHPALTAADILIVA